MTTALRMAIELLGSQAALARCVGIRPQAVQQWAIKGRVPAARCLSVEQATRGRVSRYDLRPDVFGPEPSC
ncbi:MAG: transcriptional regulator, partial [Gammaproteobacteria bacterium]